MQWRVIYGTIQQWTGEGDVSFEQFICYYNNSNAIVDVCMGYNTLHMVETVTRSDELDEFSEDLPNCKRVWSWLILCEDKTVITIHEDPYPFRSGPLSAREQRNLGIMRRNLINVFRQCSKSRDPLIDITPLALPLRIRVGDSEKETQHRASDVPGLLFYYLFDDWLAIYTLIARRENHFAAELNDLVSSRFT
jgi:hypothetical protein